MAIVNGLLGYKKGPEKLFVRLAPKDTCMEDFILGIQIIKRVIPRAVILWLAGH